MAQEYHLSEVYKIVGKKSVHEVLGHLTEAKDYYVVIDDGDEPIPVTRCISYLESLAPSKHITLMRYEGTRTQWVGKEDGYCR